MEKPEKRIDLDSELGMSRRDLIRRGAIVGGTLLWVAPAIQSMAPKAFAQTNGEATRQRALRSLLLLDGRQAEPTNGHNRGFDGDLGSGGGLNSQADCQAFCSWSAPYVGVWRPVGGPYDFGQWCSGLHCDTTTEVESDGGAGPNGAFCT